MLTFPGFFFQRSQLVGISVGGRALVGVFGASIVVFNSFPVDNTFSMTTEL